MGLWLLNNSFSYRSKVKLLKTKTEDKSKDWRDWRQGKAEDAEVKVKRWKNVKVKFFQFLNALVEKQKGYLYYLMKIILTAVWLLWLKKFLIDADAPYDHVSRLYNLKVGRNNLLSLTSYYTKIELNVI